RTPIRTCIAHPLEGIQGSRDLQRTGMSMKGRQPTGKMAKAGVSFLKRLVFDEATLEADNRRDEDRTPVVGEVNVIVLDAEGQAVGQTRVFVRDLSKSGCGLWSRVRFASGTKLVLHFPAANG